MTDAHGSGVEYARDDSIFTTSHDHEADHEASSARTSLLFGAKAFSRWWSVSRWKWKTVFSFHRAPGSSHAPCGEKLTQKASFFRASRDHVGTRAWFAPPNARSVRRVWREGAESVPGREFRMAPSLIRQLRGDRSDCLPIRRRVFRRSGFSPSPKIVRRPVLSEKIARASEISERSPACDFFGRSRASEKSLLGYKKACAHDLKFRIALVRQTAVAPPPRTTPPTTKATRATTSQDDG